MPEIKHQFTGGKMNKDLDERLVPNGEYRDAMNVQVATSEGSAVGTIQNILGNKEMLPFDLPVTAVVIGAVSDEKIDTMYYLVWSPEVDYIFSWDGTDHKPVFVDKIASNILRFDPNNIITGINIIDGLLFWTDNVNEPKKINIQRCIDGTVDINTQTKLVNNSIPSGGFPIEEKHITVIKKAPVSAPGMILKTARDLDKVYTAIMSVSALNDNTSSFTVPSAGSTFIPPSGTHNFSSLSTADGSNIFSVKIIDGLTAEGGEIVLENPGGNVVGNGTARGLTGVVRPGFGTSTELVGKTVVLQAYNVDENGLQTPPGIPLTDFVIKGIIVEIPKTPTEVLTTGVFIDVAIENILTIQITSVDGFADSPDFGTLKYVIDFYEEKDKLFEFKYPRFSYRYKFEDGEYSPFGPFTQVAFSPGAFDYHPRKGYNIGMTNRLTEVKLLDIVSEKTPVDVVSIDILFKDDASPSIYVVDTIKPDDYSLPGEQNTWDALKDSSSLGDGFSITREAISSILPSNQLLRPYDNVPKKALGQDVTGSRIVYGNYTQNYDLIAGNNKKYVPNFSIFKNESFFELDNPLVQSNQVSSNVSKSIKSLREYQLGVVFIDEYGRETPVISNTSGTVKYEKIDAVKANRIGVKFNSDDYPESLAHFKFFIKETSTEYYNMAMDRWYSAGDNNIWLAFPSSDRNKIDIDTFLILKKGSDKDDLVVEEARYKVLAIENEAPDFIKTQRAKKVSVTHSASSPSRDIFGSFGVDAPFEGFDEFKMNYKPFSGTSGRNLAEDEDELWIEFGKLGDDQISDRYKITSITNDIANDETNIATSKYSVKLEKRLGNDVNFISDSLGSTQTKIETGAIVNVYRYKVENLDKFDGRFFVKIYFDEVFRKNIEKSTTGGGSRVTSSKKVYSMRRDYVEKHTSDVNNFLISGVDSLGSKYNGSTVNPGGPIQAGEWLNYKNENLMQWRYGYYLIDEFTANALFFRKYRIKDYAISDSGATQVQGDEFDQVAYDDDEKVIGNQYPTEHPSTAANNYNTANFKVLIHLQNDINPFDTSNPTKNKVDNTFPIEYQGNKYKDAKDWHLEFGYKTNTTSFSVLSGLVAGEGYSSTFTSTIRGGLTAGWRLIKDPDITTVDADGDVNGIGNKQWNYNSGFVSTGNLINYNSGLFQHISSGVQKGYYQSDIDQCRDNEVWFIDHGKIDGFGISPNLKYDRVSPAGFTSLPVYTNSQEEWASNNVSSQPKGLKTYNNEWKMDLAFGGLRGGLYDDGGGVASLNPEKAGFWEIGNWNNTSTTTTNDEYQDTPTTKFVSKLNAGERFRWREDPTRQIYTVGDASQKSYLRHSWGNKDKQSHYLPGMSRDLSESKLTTLVNPINNSAWSEDQRAWDLNAMAENISFNFTKNWLLEAIEPSITWNPMYEGVIPGGLSLTIDAVSSPTTGVAVSGSSTDLAVDLKIYVKSLVVGASVLHVGMALTHYDVNGGATISVASTFLQDGLVIRYIIPVEVGGAIDHFELYLGGYNKPLSAADHLKLVGTYTPAVGGSYVFQQLGMNGYSPNSEFNINTIASTAQANVGKIGAIGYTLEFLDEIQPIEILSENPAIWETEPKESTALEVYYEACGSIPAVIDENTIQDALPIGTKFRTGTPGSETNYFVTGYNGDKVIIEEIQEGIAPITIPVVPPSGLNFVKFYRPDDLILEIQILSADVKYSSSYKYGFFIEVSFYKELSQNKFILPWHNCYSFKNGVESNRIRDNFNLPFISNGVKASATLDQEYKEEHRKYGLIYSGIYNSTSGINNLNQFIAAEKITKDVNPIYGSIQKLYSRDSDLVALCEDKILRIQANKDALFNADGNSNVVASSNVLGQTIPFSGEFGISTNPESFASESYRAYFTDRVRGAVMRLSKDGITPISDAGMKDWFRDNLRGATSLIGSYDDRNDEYNLRISNLALPVNVTGKGKTSPLPSYTLEEYVLSFSEKVGGWVSFKSFTNMQYGISLANNYYTFDKGNLFLHYDEQEDRNTFYGAFSPSTFDVILNDDPGSIKVFNTLNYEGSQAKVNKFKSQLHPNGTTYNDQEYYNLYEKEGWSVESIVTNKEEGKINEFLEKDGEWFNGISKVIDIDAVQDAGDFTFQGIGIVGKTDTIGVAVVKGCTDPLALNYNAAAVVDDGTCNYPDAPIIISGCTDPLATNFNPKAIDDDGSCVYKVAVVGCMDPDALNYNPLATLDDGLCKYPILDDDEEKEDENYGL